MLSGLLPSNGPGIVDMGACFGFHENMFTALLFWQWTTSGPAILASSHHVTVLSVHDASHGKASLIHITETNVMDNTAVIVIYRNGTRSEANPFEEEEWDEEGGEALVDTGEPGVPVKALYDYEGAESDELSFRQGA
jgi:hypothetical protein